MTQRVIVTRPRAEGLKWVAELELAGFDAVALPLIDIAPAPHPQALQDAWARQHTYDAVMFVSSNAVDYFFASKQAAALAERAQSAIKIGAQTEVAGASAFTPRAFVTGPGSYAALQRAGVAPGQVDAPDLQAGQFDSEALWAVVGQRVRPGFRLLIVRGAGEASAPGDDGLGRDWFAQQASAAGASVEFVVAYQRLCPQFTDAERSLVQMAAADGSLWLFSSSEAIANLLANCAQQSWQQARAVVTHPRIAQAARAAGFGLVCESRPTMQALVASIESMQ